MSKGAVTSPSLLSQSSKGAAPCGSCFRPEDVCRGCDGRQVKVTERRKVRAGRQGGVGKGIGVWGEVIDVCCSSCSSSLPPRHQMAL